MHTQTRERLQSLTGSDQLKPDLERLVNAAEKWGEKMGQKELSGASLAVLLAIHDEISSGISMTRKVKPNG